MCSLKLKLVIVFENVNSKQHLERTHGETASDIFKRYANRFLTNTRVYHTVDGG